jgi:predicted DNA-binding protein (UPF0251 family)
MSPRNKKNRIIRAASLAQSYKPIGVPASHLAEVVIASDEFEALRLADYEYLSQEQAASKMGVSRPTFTRIYNAVRKKIALAIVEGRTIVFDVDSQLVESEFKRCGKCNQKYYGNLTEDTSCPDCNDLDADATDFERKCECRRCGYVLIAKQGLSCRQLTCPQCGSMMKRKL